MNIEKNIRDDHQAELTVEVEAERLETMKRRAARKISERGKIPGFRPGKAPYDVIRRHYGDEPILEQAIEMLVDDIYPEVLKQAEIEPAAMGALEKIESMEPPKFIFRVPMLPSVNLGDYLSIRVPYEWTAPGEAELLKTLDGLRQMYGTTETVDRAVQEGDYLLVSVKGEKQGAAEGEDLSALVRENTATIVRLEDQLQENEWPFKGFARQLIGVQPGESKTVTHSYPQDYEEELVRGATVVYEVAVKTVRAVSLPELNDEFAKTVSEQYESLDQLKEALQKENEARSQADYDDEYFARVIDRIKENASIKYPPQVLEHENEHVLEDLQQRLSSQGMDLATYFKVRNTTQEKFIEEEVTPAAKKRLERGLILDEVARQQKILIDEESLRGEFDQTINQLAYQGLDFEKLSKQGKKAQENFSTVVANESAARLMTRRTLERLKRIATGEYKPGEETAEEAPAEIQAEQAAPGPEAGAESGQSVAEEANAE